MRLRALPLLLVLTACDYVLWDWSIAGGHDVLSLISGLTLLPLAAVTLSLVALGAARVCGAILEAARDRRRPPAIARTSTRRRTNARASHSALHQQPQPSSNAKPAARSEERSSRRLAA